MDVATIGQSVLRVLLAGLAFGAGLPAIFALGVALWTRGTDEPQPDGSVRKGTPVALAGAVLAFAVVAGVVVLGVLWITAKSLHHYFGIDVFGA